MVYDPQPRTATEADEQSRQTISGKVVAALERARDVINDPATPEKKVQKIGAILEAFKYRRPPFTRRPKTLNF